ncbi:MAG: hypothetical protein GY707_16810 [Desulfobacteraceae bacterium]|nr:hypothetical protein [Desulfobacteraceae bacterium]
MRNTTLKISSKPGWVADVDDSCHDEEDDDEGFEDFDDEMSEEEVHRHISIKAVV